MFAHPWLSFLSLLAIGLPLLFPSSSDGAIRSLHLSSWKSKKLREKIDPFFLRCEKKEESIKDDVDAPKFAEKNELIVWLKLSNYQRQLYEAFLKSKQGFLASDATVAALTILKNICDNPQLLTKKDVVGMGRGHP